MITTPCVLIMMMLVSGEALGGCVPAPRAYRIFLPPQTTTQTAKEPLEELEELFASGKISHEE